MTKCLRTIALRTMVFCIVLLFFAYRGDAASPPTSSMRYDARGNLTDGVDGDHYTYTPQGKLASIERNGNIIAEYFYDSNTNLVKKKENGTTLHYIGSAYQQEVGKEGTTFYTYQGKTIAKRQGKNAPTYFATDPLGTVKAEISASGAVLSRYRYDPFGKVLSEKQPSSRGFTNQEFSSQTNLYDYNARTYDPRLRKFLQPDSIVPNAQQPLTLNRYAYAQNNPQKYSDPTGHIVFTPYYFAEAVQQNWSTIQQGFAGLFQAGNSLFSGIGNLMLGQSIADDWYGFQEGLYLFPKMAIQPVLTDAGNGPVPFDITTPMYDMVGLNPLIESMNPALSADSRRDLLGEGASKIITTLAATEISLAAFEAIPFFASQPIRDALVTTEKSVNHVKLHEQPNYNKQLHGVFFGDSLAITQSTWTTQNCLSCRENAYKFFSPNVGYMTGINGNGERLNYMTIVQENNMLITSFPSR